MNPDILMVAEHRKGVILPITFELVSLAYRIQEHRQCEVSFLVVEGPESAVSGTIASQTGLNVEAVRLDHTGPITGEVYRQVLGKVLSRRQFSTLIIPHTTLGMDYAPGLAVGLGAACISAVTGVDFLDNQLVFRRLIYGGKLHEQVSSRCGQVVVTAAPGSFASPGFSPAIPGGRTVTPAPSYKPETVHLKTIPGAGQAEGLSEARIIVAAGNGIGGREAIDLISEMAGLFSRAAVAGSRPVCDRGWLPYNCQVGVTGARVAPEVYIACGISGAYQHVAGIQDSGVIVAINTDPGAAIFKVSDICIVADLKAFIQAFSQCVGESGTEKD